MGSAKCFLLFLVVTIATVITVSAKNIDHTTTSSASAHHPHAHTDSRGIEDKTCESILQYFSTLNVTISTYGEASGHSVVGPVCGGYCCDNQTEEHLFKKSTYNFERLLHHHTRSLHDTLETTARMYRSHIIELSHQSENKTLNLFSQVYRQMSPLSHQPILDLYQNIRSPLSSQGDSSLLEEAVKRFFVKLFPVAYHHVVHGGGDIFNGDFHEDYKNCLMHTFDDLKPFGDIPHTLAKTLSQSVSSATIFLKSLDAAVQIFKSTENLDESNLTPKCRNHLLKMSYCPQCNGISKHRVRTCYGYCINIMRGCLAQHVGVLDIPWSKVAEAIEKLYYTSIKTDNGIEESIKTLDVKLSEAIMHAMENGLDLEKKVKKSCGVPNVLPLEKTISHLNDIDTRPGQQPVNSKWVPTPNTEMLHFLVTINKSKDFYSNIIDSYCEDDEFKNDNTNCWTGDRVGEYTQTIMTQNEDAQKYNPEVPLVPHTYTRAHKLSELVDQLIKLRHSLGNAIVFHTHSYSSSDIQGDMATDDGSAFQDYEENAEGYPGSGEGSGNGASREDVSQTVSKDTPQILSPSDASQAQLAISSATLFFSTFVTYAIYVFRRL